MAKFNFIASVIGLVNTVFGTTVAYKEDQDEPTLFAELKQAVEASHNEMKTKLDTLTGNAEQYEALQTQVQELTAEVDKYKKLNDENADAIVKMQSAFDSKLLKLREEVRAELAKEGQTGTGQVATGLKENEDETKELVIDGWKQAHQAPKVSIGV